MLDKTIIEELELELTGWCNLKCPMCSFNFLEDHDRAEKQPKLSDVIPFLEQFPNLKKILLVGEYSEPTAYKDFFPLIDYLNKRDIAIQIGTNGTVHNDKWWKELSKKLKSKDRVDFTIDGHLQEIHEKYRRGSDLNKIVRHIKAFLDPVKKHDHVLTVLFQFNENYIEDIKKFVKDIGVCSHEIASCKPHINKKIHTNGYIKEFDTVNVGPSEITKRKYDVIFKRMNDIVEKRNNGEEFIIECKSKLTKWIYVTNNLEILPCTEFAKLYKNQRMWDQDYNTIEKFKYDCCAICEKSVRKLTDNLLGKDYLM